MSLLGFLGLTKSDLLTVGAPAPVVEVIDQDGNSLSLADVYRKGIVLLYFYPKADTPGCTAQACSLRDSFGDLKAIGVTVLGASIDTPAAQKRFQEKYSLPFPLVADNDGSLAKSFGVPTVLGLAAKRVAFLIRDGVVVWVDGNASTAKHADDVRAAVAGLKAA